MGKNDFLSDSPVYATPGESHSKLIIFQKRFFSTKTSRQMNLKKAPWVYATPESLTPRVYATTGESLRQL